MIGKPFLQVDGAQTGRNPGSMREHIGQTIRASSCIVDDRLGEYFLSEGVLDTEDDGVTPSKNIRSESQTAVSPS
jgi:hypothetical protein